MDLLDENAEALGGAAVTGAQAALLPGTCRALEEQGARGVDLGDAGNVHLAGEVGCRRDRHAKALQRLVQVGGFRHRPGAGGDQAEGGSSELDTEAGGAGLGRQDELMVALEHGRA